MSDFVGIHPTTWKAPAGTDSELGQVLKVSSGEKPTTVETMAAMNA